MAGILKNIQAGGHLKFDEGKLTIVNIPSQIYPIFTLVLEEEIGMKLFGDDYRAFKYFLGEQQGMMGAKLMYERHGFRLSLETIKMSNQHSELVGTGKIEIKKFSKDFVIASIEDNPFAKSYLKIFGPQKDNNDFFQCGIFGGAYMVHLNNDNIFCFKERCITDGSKSCIFHIKDKKKFGEEYQKIIKKVSELRNEFKNYINLHKYFS